jgi:short-subunit dehydrogenase
VRADTEFLGWPPRLHSEVRNGGLRARKLQLYTLVLNQSGFFMTDNSSNKPVAIVTGASAGIGMVYAQRLAARGFDLILVARRADRLVALSKEVQDKHGTKVEIVAADLTDPADLARLEKLVAADKRVSMLVNNAGNAKLAPMSRTSTEDAASMIALNITALVRLTQAVLPGFLAKNSGSIINIASVLSLHSLPISSVYSGTKGYVLNFTRGLQAELAGTGVKVQLVLPATTSTELWDLAGVPLSQLNQSSIMSAEKMVDASLAGYDQGEAVTFPSVDDASLWSAYDAARGNLFAATQTGRPASRYGVN